MENEAGPRALYIDLLKKCLVGAIYDPRQGRSRVTVDECAILLQQANEVFKTYLEPRGHTLESFFAAEPNGMPINAEAVAAMLNGMHRDLTPDTMSALSSIDNVQACVEAIIRDDVPGDLIETGIWKGGMPLFMRGILKAYGIEDRVVWGADSFEGLPKPDPKESLIDAISYHLSTPLEQLKIPFDYVQGVFRKFDLLDDKVKFLAGWFSDTLPGAPIDKLALLRLDGDWYESTMCALNALYPKVSPGGFVIVDDYGLALGCKRAIDEYRIANEIADPIRWVNHQVAFWQKS